MKKGIFVFFMLLFVAAVSFDGGKLQAFQTSPISIEPVKDWWNDIDMDCCENGDSGCSDGGTVRPNRR